MVNCLIKALNDASKLPHIILIIPDSDALAFVRKQAESDYKNITMFIEGALNWMVNQMV